MLESEGAVKLPSAARSDFDDAKSSYRTWLDSQGDFFLEDEVAAAAADFQSSLEAVAAKSLGAGVDRQQLLTAMIGAFPEARELVTELISSIDVKTPATPMSAESVVRPSPATSAAWTRSCPACASDGPLDAEYCSKCGAELGEPGFSDLLPLLHELQSEIDALRSRKKGQPGLPKTNLLANDFMTRAFAVYGHMFVASMIISLPIYLLVLLVSLVGR